MATIQIDMFEVQLGASLLLQFQDEDGGQVQVLADAGITERTGYTQGHVHNKLRSMMQNDKMRLDLLIATHYDEDHLFGLIPIIEDDDIEIAEAWLPPVANDLEMQPVGGMVLHRDLLAEQFAGDNGHRVLSRYLQAKQAACEELLTLERSADGQRSFSNSRQDIKPMNFSSLRHNEGTTSSLEYFRGHEADAAVTLRDTPQDLDLHEFNVMSDTVNDYRHGRWMNHPMYNSPDRRQKAFVYRWDSNPETADLDAIRFAYLRKATAKDAITAIHLANLVAALKKKKQKNNDLRIVCHIIEDGKPQRFVWDKVQRRFIQGAKLPSHGPEIVQLGPSQSLVKKLRDKLPVAEHLSWFHPVAVRSITPSNQLSYVFRFQAENQGILVCGDAGCVDFKESPRNFYKSLLDRLLPLNIIQIAHHGGCNGHFYNVLLEAGYPDQSEKSLLLLSHATEDPTRPSKEFAAFIGQARRPGDDMKLLFTSRPSTEKVRDYIPVIHPRVVTTTQTGNNVGDVRVLFDGTEWKVESHAIDFSSLQVGFAATPPPIAAPRKRKRRNKSG